MSTVADQSGEKFVGIGPPPPFDPALDAVLAAARVGMPVVSIANLEALRAPRRGMEPASLDELRRGGAFRVEELTIPGPAGAPDLSLLICRPAQVGTQVPLLYHIHPAA
jgi:hypothetical protein